MKVRQSFALLLVAAVTMVGLAPTTTAGEPSASYIVLLRADADPRAAASDHAARLGAEPFFVYSSALKGYAARIPQSRLEAVKADRRVLTVEPDHVATITHHRAGHGGEETAETQAAQTLPWGIDRIDADISSTRAGDGAGAVSNVNVYVLDTGVDSRHPDLNVVGHLNFVGGPNKDCNGHGTHVAGTIAARDNSSDVVGVVPGAKVTGIKVLGCSGSGSYSAVIAGVDWVTKNALKPAIANMSLSGPPSSALDNAVRTSADSGVFYSLAAGNEGTDACGSSPARAGTHAGVMTVAATSSTDSEASWSNYGSCVDIWAPGVSILSTKNGGGTTTMSGTSMAAPHVGGAGALYLSNSTLASPSSVESSLSSTSQLTTKTSKDGATIRLVHVATY